MVVHVVVFSMKHGVCCAAATRARVTLLTETMLECNRRGAGADPLVRLHFPEHLEIITSATQLLQVAKLLFRSNKRTQL